jgi:hypothetical protein
MLDESDESKHLDSIEDLLKDGTGGILGRGGVVPTAQNRRKLKVASPKNFICLRGPCRHYFEARGPFPTGTKGFEAPTVINRVCMRLPGTFLDLFDEVVEACNCWDPRDVSSEADINARRDAYRAANPDTEATDQEGEATHE